MDISKAIEVSQKLEKARKSIKFLFGDDYEKKIKPWKELIKNVAKKYKISNMQASIKLCGQRGDAMFEDGMTQLVILSASCDLAEE
jgi:hypothetical protein